MSRASKHWNELFQELIHNERKRTEAYVIMETHLRKELERAEYIRIQQLQLIQKLGEKVLDLESRLREEKRNGSKTGYESTPYEGP